MMLIDAGATTGVETVAISWLRGEGYERLCFIAELAKLCWLQRVDAHARACVVATLTSKKLVVLCRKQAVGAA